MVFLFYSKLMVNLEFFFEPKNIAIIGASAKPGKIGYEILKNVVEAGYDKDVYPINAKGEDGILGLKTYRSVLDVPSNVDLAVYALPAKYAPKIVDECGKKGVKGMVIISGGFKELGGEGAELEREVVEKAKKHNIRVIGPNCMGIFNPNAKVDTFFQPRYAMTRPREGNVGVLTQSGTFGISMLEWIAEEHLGISKFVSYGNRADVDELEMLRYLMDDPDTKVIALYVESLSNGKEFMKLAKEIVRKKPVVMLKGGRSSAGSKAAESHTGSLTGDDAVFVGAMRQCGVVLVEDVDELVDVVKIISMQPLPKGNGIAMVTNGVGPCVVAADDIEFTRNLKLSVLSGESIKKLRQVLPEFCIFSNPLDITGSASAEWFRQSMDILRGDEDVDILMPFFVFQDAPLSETIEAMHTFMSELNDSEKTMLCVASGGEFTKTQVKKLQANGIPCIPISKRAVMALSRVVWYSRFLNRT